MKLPPNPNSIIIQLIAITLIISIVPVAIVTYNNSQAIGKMKQTQFEDRLSDLAVISDQMYDTHVDRDNAMARTISRDYGLKTAIDENDRIAVKRIVDGYSGTDQNVSILLVTDRNGTIIASASYLNSSGNLSDEFIRGALAGKGVTGTDVIPASILQENCIDYKTVSAGTADGLGIICAQPIKGVNETVVGAVYLVELLNENTNLVDAIASDAGGQCTIFMGDVRIATSLKNSYNVRLLGTRMGPTPAPAVLIETGQYRSYYDYDGQHFYLNYAPIKSPEGEVVGMIAVGYDVNPSLKEIDMLIYLSIATGVIIALIFTLLGLIYVRRITKPVQNLVTAAGKISSGELDTPLEACEDGSEIGDLEIAIKKMVQSIKARINYDESLLKGITDPMLVIDSEGQITYFNEPAAKMTGYPVREALGRKYTDIFTISPGEGATLTDYVSAHKFASGFENALLLRDGKKVIVSGSSAPFTGADGTITGTILLLRDITVQKEAEKALRRKQFIIAKSQEIARVGNLAWDVRTGEVMASAQGFRNLGYELDDHPFTIEQILDHVHPEDAQMVAAFTRSVTTDGRTGSIDYRVVSVDRSVKYANTIIDKVVRDEDGKVKWAYGIIQDITERKLAENAIRESEARFRILSETTSGAILIIQDREFVYVNPAACAMTGYESTELLGMNFRSLVHPDYLDLAMARYEARLEKEAIPASYELKIIDKKQEKRWIEISSGTIVYNNKPAVIVTGFDITERKCAEVKTIASLKEKEVLLKEIHHRVKNNLQIINSLMNLQSTYVKDSEALEMFRESQSRVKSMALIHERLYQSQDLSHIDFGEYVKKLAGYLVQSYGSTARDVQLSIDANDLQIDIDRAIPCGLILNELLTNAFKYAFPNGRAGKVHIRFKHSGSGRTGQYRLAVADDGIGLPDSVDIENSSTLGLQLVASLVAQLEGTLVVNRGPGTEFIITFSEEKKPNSLIRRDEA